MERAHRHDKRLEKTEQTTNVNPPSQSLAFIKIKVKRILSIARTLAGTNYGISQDFRREIVKIWKGLINQSNERSIEGGS